MVVDDMSASEYLNQLLQDKTTIAKMPKIFLHAERLLDEGKDRFDVSWFCGFVLTPLIRSSRDHEGWEFC